MAGGAAGGFITRALESMLKECSNKKYSALQTAIQSYIDNSKASSQQSLSTESDAATSSAVDQSSTDTGASENEAAPVASATALPSGEGAEQISGPASQSGTIVTALAQAGNTLSQAQAELVLNPLRLAFETKNGKIMELALDCLHKLIAYDHLEGDLGLDGGKNVTLFTDILNRVCSCVDNLSPDSTTLQVLKVLLTAVASSKFRVHGESLLGVIRVCYNIALNSKSPINQATSKAMLTQMLSIIFRRMENDLGSRSCGPVAHQETTDTNEPNVKDEEVSHNDLEDKEITEGGDAPSVVKAKDTPASSVEELQSFVGGADIKGLEAALEKAVHLEDGEKVTRGIELESMSPGEHDALLLFRTLCKMGIKEDNDEVTVKTRILSLELLQGLLERLAIEEIQVEPPKSNEVRMKMLFASLCHTDLLGLNGYPAPLFPRVLGHEGVGMIESVGENVTNIKEGDIVMPLYLGECKECPNCKSGRSNLCHKYPVTFSGLMLDGTSRMSIHGGQVLYHFFNCSTWSEYTVINANYVIKVDPQKIPLPHASLLCCGFTTGYGATSREVHVQKGSTVAVLGLGTVGLGVVEGTRSQGVSKIIGVDTNELKREKGEAFGMTDFINPKDNETSISEMIKGVTGGLGVDYVFECTGIPCMLNEAIDASKLGIGTIVLIGAGNGNSREFDLLPLLCGRTLKGSIFGGMRLHSDLPALLHRCENKEIQLDELITHQISLTEINQAFELLKDPHCVKVIIKF